MDTALKEKFLRNWQKYFPGAALPIGFYYSPKADVKIMPKAPQAHRCVIADLAKVRHGKDLCLGNASIGCGGGKRFLGFQTEPVPDFAYFLSYGIPGKLEGERYKKSPEMVREHLKHQQPFQAPEDYVIFKRWDNMGTGDQPVVVIFFAPPDVIAGLFTLANFDEPEPQGVITPFGAGCASIVDYPYQEIKSARPRAVLGMFDVSARPCVPAQALTFAVPWTKFVRMVNNMEESFLITKSWGKVKRRIKTGA